MDAWLLAIGLMLVLEGLMPMVAPTRWRRLFEQLLQLQDGQIRFFGVFLVLLGLAFLWWAD
ncbi:MAG: DUF2065 domain-containing protein [Limnohabitans sp.]